MLELPQNLEGRPIPSKVGTLQKIKKAALLSKVTANIINQLQMWPELWEGGDMDYLGKASKSSADGFKQ